ncbi:MAG: hypothetical protein KGH53_02735 [Candidatus Micrarchaeota archaeon]|nr:hypothetical protein [Candidatus Micrarchaeota archaeon]
MRTISFEKERQTHTKLQSMSIAKTISPHAYLVLKVLQEKGEMSGTEISKHTGIEKSASGNILTYLMRRDLAILRYDEKMTKRYSFDEVNGGLLIINIENNSEAKRKLMSGIIANFSAGMEQRQLVGNTEEVYANIMEKEGLLRG